MKKEKKYLFLYICMTALLVVCLSGCGKSKIANEESYSPDEVTALQMEVDTWNSDIMLSSDDDIHVSFDGSISNEEKKPSVTLQDGILSIAQKSGDEGLQDQIAFGKKGQITVYLPADCIIPVTLKNGMGDIEIDGVVMGEFLLDNSSGYATLSAIVSDNIEILSGSGDITIKNSSVDRLSIETSSGYVQISETDFNNGDIVTKSGETTLSKISPDRNINMQSGSGDINLTYLPKPENLDFAVTSGSKDITAHFDGANYSKETSESKQGTIGKGEFELTVNSDSGTVVIK